MKFVKQTRTVSSFFIFIFILFGSLSGQSRLYEGPDDPASDPAMRREGHMSGNRVFLYFRNTTELSNCCGVQYSEWPQNEDGLPITDGVALLIGSRTFVDAADDSTIVTDPYRIHNGSGLDTLYFCQTSYREETDFSPDGTVEWGFNPVKGYFNLDDEYVAMSHIPSSWPPDGWPATGRTKKWKDEWNGRFGRGVKYADQETYFVANDAQDLEYIFNSLEEGPTVESPVYYPRPGVFIGDSDPDVTTQNGLPWGGLGLRVEVRSFQWNNIQARDNIFFEYTIANISDYDLPQVAFGYWVDNGIGGNWPYDDLGFFDTYEDMSYSWDKDGIGEGGRITGVFGFAYLESPGAPYDFIDNDEDGLLDEKRDNDAGTMIGPEDGIHDLQAFLTFYGRKREELAAHWSGDEDQDWEDGDDTNGDGIYQEDEFYGDDVGLDGVGPYDLNYEGPDEGECNHKPDYREGIGCEPNFAVTDISESDMIGLTTFQLFPVPRHSSPYHNWFRHDYDMWTKLSSDVREEYDGITANLVEYFASSIFPLYKGRTERISMSMLHSYDPVAGLNASGHKAPSLFIQKQIVQGIYETDYRFAQPPEMPTLKAIPLDGKVILTWDDRADKKTREPFLKNVNDFEGYKLYRSTDINFADAEQITDGFGTKSILKPIYQCDKVDEYERFAEWGEFNGQGFYLGDNSGITHYHVDETVENGRTYYYGLAAYDYGIPEFGDDGISPSENNLVIDVDEFGNIRNLGKNIQIVVPRAKSAGYVSGDIEFLNGDDGNVRGTAFNISLMNDALYESEKEYKISFGYDTIGAYIANPFERTVYDMQLITNKLFVHDPELNDSIIYSESSTGFPSDNIVTDDEDNYMFNPNGVKTEIFKGLQIEFEPNYDTVSVDYEQSGWLVGESDLTVEPNLVTMNYYPWEYEIVFTNSDSAYTSITELRTGIKDINEVQISPTRILFNQSYNFYVINKSFRDENGEFPRLDVLTYDVSQDGEFTPEEDFYLIGFTSVTRNKNKWAGTILRMDFSSLENIDDYPQPGDVYRLYFKRPFGFNDSLMFKVNPPKNTVKSSIAKDMKKIKVVPNPYIAGNAMEPASTIVSHEQKRRIMFTNVPSECVIKIFTVSGYLVDEIRVDNNPGNGAVHWDLLTHENLEISAGIYIYHIESAVSGDEVIGKFAVIK